MNMNSPKLIKNCIETPDGTIIQSHTRHDYVTHLDENGKTYFTDGGLAYVRCSAHGDEIHHCVWDDEPFDKVRTALEWGTYGKKGDQPLSYVRLCDMETDHIRAVLDTAKSIAPQFKEAMITELEYRQIEGQYESS